jgi:signal transduction histidine kinase
MKTDNPREHQRREAEKVHIERRFPFVFLDQNMLLSGTAQPKPAMNFSVMVYGNASASAQAALAGASRILALIAVAAIASVIALLQTVRAVRANVRLASMKSDFVSAVTHELKTPVATVRLVGDTLARGRYPPEAIQEYARLLSQEASRLTSSIDHLLTYASYADVNVSRQLERVPMDLIDVVDDALDHFRPTLLESGFDVRVNVARELPKVSVDARAITQVVEIIIDNAIKYSGDSRLIEMAGSRDGRNVRLTVKIMASGFIPTIFLTCDRFVRGRNARASAKRTGTGHRPAHHAASRWESPRAQRPRCRTEVDVILRAAP